MINLISWISLIGLSVGTAALIIVLSVYNGIGKVTQSLFNVFDPELVVKPAKGKTFSVQAIPYHAVEEVPHVARVSQIVEDHAWATYKRNQAIVKLRGVDSVYGSMTGLDTLLHEGVYLLKQQTGFEEGWDKPSAVHFVVMGATIYDELGITPTSTAPLALNVPKRRGGGITDPFNTGYAYAAGNFYVQQEIDATYMVADIDFVRTLMGYGSDEVTSIAFQLDDAKYTRAVQKQLRQLLGADYEVLNRFEQQPLYYKVYRSERLGIYLILSLIILIATLNLIASLSLLILDKRRDIALLQSLGMSQNEVRKVFLHEGMMICTLAVVAGLAVGGVLCFLQQYFGLVKMGGNFVVQAFPVQMQLRDFLISFCLVMAISSIAVCFSVRKAKI